jgi:ectoine hydroxylase-related dioxygenase (phytanoyl-CoA dioxygenase family)
MSFRFSDAHIQEYHTRGYTVFREIVPAPLVGDLRRATDQAREAARRKTGTQAQRLQPVAKFEIEQKPFRDYAGLPALREAITKLLSARHTHPNDDWLGVLLEPAETPYCTIWHRDWRDNVQTMPIAAWEAVFRDINYFNQVNCALYEDSSTWVVPGSHLRQDLQCEVERFPDRPIRGPELDGRTSEERERLCRQYCESMPGAVQLHLDAGDLALYRNTLWHIGSYVPYRKRATLHDLVDTPEYLAWRERIGPEMEKRKAEGRLNENPNRRAA